MKEIKLNSTTIFKNTRPQQQRMLNQEDLSNGPPAADCNSLETRQRFPETRSTFFGLPRRRDFKLENYVKLLTSHLGFELFKRWPGSFNCLIIVALTFSFAASKYGTTQAAFSMFSIEVFYSQRNYQWGTISSGLLKWISQNWVYMQWRGVSK